jgi:hypothetical protein
MQQVTGLREEVELLKSMAKHVSDGFVVALKPRNQLS